MCFIRTKVSGLVYENAKYLFSDIQSSFDSKFENENGGEIPRRSVDQGLSTSPKSTTVDYYMFIIGEVFKKVNYHP